MGISTLNTLSYTILQNLEHLPFNLIIITSKKKNITQKPDSISQSLLQSRANSLEMGINCLTNLTKRGLLQLSEQRFSLNSGVYIVFRSQFNQNQQQQYRAYAHNFSKLKNPDSRRPFYVPKSPRRWYSSTPSSSKQKVGLLAWYLGMLESRPIITKSISSGIIYGVADLTSQVYIYIYMHVDQHCFPYD